MRAEILTIGDELTRGEILDTNARFFAEQLTALGFHVAWMSSSTDDVRAIREALERAAGRSAVVLVSGGLGPTEDDRTVDAIAALAGAPAVVEAEALERMRARYARSGMEMTPNNLRQVRVIEGAAVLANRAGIAPGFRLKLGGAEVFVMPGVPSEMEAIWRDAVEPHLRGMAAGLAVRARTLHIHGLPESHIDHRLAGLTDGHEGVTVHFRIVLPETRVKLVVRDATVGGAETRLAALEAEARARLGRHVYGVDGDTFAAAVGRVLRERSATVAFAESCTGGLAAATLTSVPGSSDYFRLGVVAYSNESKQRLLGVRSETLERFGAVSDACAREMAEGARRAASSTIAISATGIAGPDGGTPEKPVGTVWFGIAGPRGIDATHLVWPGDRAQVQARAAHHVLRLVYEYWDEERA